MPDGAGSVQPVPLMDTELAARENGNGDFPATFDRNAFSDIVGLGAKGLPLEVRVSDPQSQPAWEAILTDPALRLSAFEVACARLHANGVTDEEIPMFLCLEELEDAADAKPSARRSQKFSLVRRAGWAWKKAEERIQAAYSAECREALAESRAVDDAMRGKRTTANASRPLIGLHPLTDCLDTGNWEKWLRVLEDRTNYQEVSLRGRLQPRATLGRASRIDLLRALAEDLGGPVPALSGR